MLFTVMGVALVQSLLLRHRLPRLIWPCAAAMVAGAAMVLVPTLGGAVSGGGCWPLRAGAWPAAAAQPAVPVSPAACLPCPAHPRCRFPQSSAGGLTGLAGWLGLLLSVITMLCTVANFVALQAFRGMGFTALELQVKRGLSRGGVAG